jgi:hypothetical protein
VEERKELGNITIVTVSRKFLTPTQIKPLVELGEDGGRKFDANVSKTQ